MATIRKCDICGHDVKETRWLFDKVIKGRLVKTEGNSGYTVSIGRRNTSPIVPLEDTVLSKMDLCLVCKRKVENMLDELKANANQEDELITKVKENSDMRCSQCKFKIFDINKGGTICSKHKFRFTGSAEVTVCDLWEQKTKEDDDTFNEYLDEYINNYADGVDRHGN